MFSAIVCAVFIAFQRVSAQDQYAEEEHNLSQGLLDIVRSRRTINEEIESDTDYEEDYEKLNNTVTSNAETSDQPKKKDDDLIDPASDNTGISDESIHDKENTNDDVKYSDVIDNSIKETYPMAHLKTVHERSDKDQKHGTLVNNAPENANLDDGLNTSNKKTTTNDIVILDETKSNNNNLPKTSPIEKKTNPLADLNHRPHFKTIVYERELIEKPIHESIRFDNFLLDNVTKAVNDLIKNKNRHKKVLQKFLKVESVHGGFKVTLISGNDIVPENLKKSLLVGVVDDLGNLVNAGIKNHITETADGRPVVLQSPISMRLNTVLNMIKSKLFNDKSKAASQTSSGKERDEFGDTIDAVNKLIYGRQ